MRAQSMPSTGRYSQTPKGPSYERFWYCQEKHFRKEIVALSQVKKFSKPKKFSSTEGFVQKIFGTVSKKDFDEKS